MVAKGMLEEAAAGGSADAGSAGRGRGHQSFHRKDSAEAPHGLTAARVPLPWPAAVIQESEVNV